MFAAFAFSRIHDAFAGVNRLCKDGAAMQEDASKGISSDLVTQLAKGVKHKDTAGAAVGNYKLVKRGARDAVRPAQDAAAQKAVKRAVDVKYGDAAVAVLGDCNAAVVSNKAQSLRSIQRSKAAQKSAVGAIEYTDAGSTFIRDEHGVVVSTHADRIDKVLAVTDEAVEAETRRQYLNATVAGVCHKYKVVRCGPHLPWIYKFQRPSAVCTDYTLTRAFDRHQAVVHVV